MRRVAWPSNGPGRRDDYLRFFLAARFLIASELLGWVMAGGSLAGNDSSIASSRIFSS